MTNLPQAHPLRLAAQYVKDNPAQFSELPEYLRVPRAIFRESQGEIKFVRPAQHRGGPVSIEDNKLTIII